MVEHLYANLNKVATASVAGQIDRSKGTVNRTSLSWISVAENAPYFVTDEGWDWHPIGQNDAIPWIDLAGLFRRRNLQSVENYLRHLSENGVTCLRLMMEYSQVRHRYLERPAGTFQPLMVQLWDDLFALCQQYGLRILLTPYDTFWMWLHWKHHPYNKKNGGMCSNRSQWLTCADTRKAIKNRLAFATERWGGSGVLFAWDLWNEIHPAHAGNTGEPAIEFIHDISAFLRNTEERLHGRSHLQTVSTFGPVIKKDEHIAYCTYCHPAIDFANEHFYETGTIDNPQNTVDPAISAGRLTRKALLSVPPLRPFFDSEHGPIHAFKDRHITLPEAFDDEYFRHIQWAHLASGGAGGGMRWPNRHPHSLTPGMRKAQKGLAGFLPLIHWQQFQRKNRNTEIEVSDKGFAVFGCSDGQQAVVWLLRTDSIGADGLVRKDVAAKTIDFIVPDFNRGHYQVVTWNTSKGEAEYVLQLEHPADGPLRLQTPPVKTDVAFAIRRLP